VASGDDDLASTSSADSTFKPNMTFSDSILNGWQLRPENSRYSAHSSL
jgi:hypothetical protein